MPQHEKKLSDLEVAEQNLRAARAALQAAEGEIQEIEGYQKEARTLGDREWLESLERQWELSYVMLTHILQAVKVEEEAVRQALIN